MMIGIILEILKTGNYLQVLNGENKDKAKVVQGKIKKSRESKMEN